MWTKVYQSLLTFLSLDSANSEITHQLVTSEDTTFASLLHL
jgi:hypothetical protein